MNELVPIGYQKGVILYNGFTMQWVDAETIGKLLYPESANPQRQVINVYTRNRSDFTEKDTILINVETLYKSEKMRNQFDYASQQTDCDILSKRMMKMRFFSVPSGVMIICKFSNSPYAVSVMKRIFELYQAYLNGTLPKPEPALIHVVAMRKWARGRGALQKAIAQIKHVHPHTVRRWANRLAQGEDIYKKPSSYVWKKHREVYNEAIRLLKEGKTLLTVEAATRVDKDTLSRWRKKEGL